MNVPGSILSNLMPIELMGDFGAEDVVDWPETTAEMKTAIAIISAGCLKKRFITLSP
jgi:hypothetical protein